MIFIDLREQETVRRGLRDEIRLHISAPIYKLEGHTSVMYGPATSSRWRTGIRWWAEFRRSSGNRPSRWYRARGRAEQHPWQLSCKFNQNLQLVRRLHDVLTWNDEKHRSHCSLPTEPLEFPFETSYPTSEGESHVPVACGFEGREGEYTECAT